MWSLVHNEPRTMTNELTNNHRPNDTETASLEDYTWCYYFPALRHREWHKLCIREFPRLVTNKKSVFYRYHLGVCLHFLHRLLAWSIVESHIQANYRRSGEDMATSRNFCDKNPQTLLHLRQHSNMELALTVIKTPATKHSCSVKLFSKRICKKQKILFAV